MLGTGRLAVSDFTPSQAPGMKVCCWLRIQRSGLAFDAIRIRRIFIRRRLRSIPPGPVFEILTAATPVANCPAIKNVRGGYQTQGLFGP
jgi:hypothetical protein